MVDLRTIEVEITAPKVSTDLGVLLRGNRAFFDRQEAERIVNHLKAGEYVHGANVEEFDLEEPVLDVSSVRNPVAKKAARRGK